MLKIGYGVLKLAKSYRNVNIRVTAENDTKQDGLVTYTLNDIENNLKDWGGSAGITYWLIEHSADADVSRTHYHIVIKFKSPMHFETIKNRFPYGDIENTRDLRNSIQYLIHLNDKSKEQYKWSDIRTNCLDLTPYMVQSNTQQEITLQGVMLRIKAHEIKEYNQFEPDKIPNELWSKYRTRIENSLTYERERIYMDKNRKIDVIFMSGATGTGKTTFAKSYCETMKKHCCISSSSNDPLQDYKGEEVLIMDDLRDTAFAFDDIIKFLDNHTRSTGRSRYHNKAFIGDTIIITSSKPITDWYFTESPYEKRQLYRRARTWFKFTPDRIYAFEYNKTLFRYELAGSVRNPMSMSDKEVATVALKVFDAMELELLPADKNALEEISNAPDEDLSKFIEIPKEENHKQKCKKKVDEYLPSGEMKS